MQATRALSILMLLQAAPRTAAELATHLEVSVRTILRDIDQLSAAGVPVYADRGRHGGLRLREGWSTTLTGMTEDESQALILAGLPVAATQLGLGEAAVRARLKALAALPTAWRGKADATAARLHIDPVDWYRAHDATPHLHEVARAVWDARVLDVRYRSWTRTERKTLEPLGLVLKAGAWYVVARRAAADAASTRAARSAARSDAAPERIYRVANIEQAIVGSRFVRPRRFDLPAHWRESARRFEAELARLQARVRLSPRALEWVHNARMPIARLGASRERAGWHDAVLALESVEHGARRLLSFADELEVLGPPQLRARMQAQATALVRLYRARASAQP